MLRDAQKLYSWRAPLTIWICCPHWNEWGSLWLLESNLVCIWSAFHSVEHLCKKKCLCWKKKLRWPIPSFSLKATLPLVLFEIGKYPWELSCICFFCSVSCYALSAAFPNLFNLTQLPLCSHLVAWAKQAVRITNGKGTLTWFPFQLQAGRTSRKCHKKVYSHVVPLKNPLVNSYHLESFQRNTAGYMMKLRKCRGSERDLLSVCTFQGQDIWSQ